MTKPTEQEMNLRMNGAVRQLYDAHRDVAEANRLPERWKQRHLIEHALDATQRAVVELEAMAKFWTSKESST